MPPSAQVKSDSSLSFLSFHLADDRRADERVCGAARPAGMTRGLPARPLTVLTTDRQVTGGAAAEGPGGIRPDALE